MLLFVRINRKTKKTVGIRPNKNYVAQDPERSIEMKSKAFVYTHF